MAKFEEQDLQTKICKWLKKEYSGLLFFSDFAAGLFLKPYLANIRAMQSCEDKFLDMVILKPISGYHGLLIEIKVATSDLFLKDGKTLKSEHVQEQFNTIKKSRELGYCADFGVGEDDIKRLIINYFNDCVVYKDILGRKIKIDTSIDDFFERYERNNIK